MTTIMPKDDDNNPIPALRLRDGAAHKIMASSTSKKNTLPFSNDTRVISVYANTAIFIEFGDSSIEATSNSHYFPAGVYYDFAINNGKQARDTHIAVLEAESSGDKSVYISEKE